MSLLCPVHWIAAPHGDRANRHGGLIVEFGIALMNADAAREIWKAAREEHIPPKIGEESLVLSMPGIWMH